MELGTAIKLEAKDGTEFVNSGVKVKKECELCIGCLELQDKIKKVSEESARLELDNRDKNDVIEKLEVEIGLLKWKNEELEERGRNGEGEDDRIAELMIENKVLECEKKWAESEVGVWKVKCRGLEMRVVELERRLSAGIMKEGASYGVRNESGNNEDKNLSGTPSIDTPSKQYTNVKGFKGDHQCGLKPIVRKCLNFALYENLSPSTPGGGPPLDPIEISDNDVDLNIGSNLDNKGRNTIQISTGGVGCLDEKELSSKDRYAESDEDETTCYISRPSYPTIKRRKLMRGDARIVSSESESNDDGDNIPICELYKNLRPHSSNILPKRSLNNSFSRENHKEPTPRRRLLTVADQEDKGVSGKLSYKSTESQNDVGTLEVLNDTVGEDGMEEDESTSEGESLGGFIVSGSDVSESNSDTNCDEVSENDGTFSTACSPDSENASEHSIAYDEVISGLRRERKDKMKWEYEADMLADFSKRPELCMKAVCALYRQQTSEEQSCKATIILNGRGFNQIHAKSGSALAVFLTDGDPQGDVNKSVEELQQFNSKGLEQCRKLATHYSKQLFEIYKNGEDAFLHP